MNRPVRNKQETRVVAVELADRGELSFEAEALLRSARRREAAAKLRAQLSRELQQAIDAPLIANKVQP